MMSACIRRQGQTENELHWPEEAADPQAAAAGGQVPTPPASSAPLAALPKIPLSEVPTISLSRAELAIEGVRLMPLSTPAPTLLSAVNRLLSSDGTASDAPPRHCILDVDERTPLPIAVNVLHALALSGFPLVEVRGLGDSTRLELAHPDSTDERPEWLALSMRADHALLRWLSSDPAPKYEQLERMAQRIDVAPAALPEKLVALLQGGWKAAPCDDLSIGSSSDIPLRDLLAVVRAVESARSCKRTGRVRLHEAHAGEVDSSDLPSARTLISGRLAPEVIQKVVREHFDAFRHCYEQGLARNPNLEGKVTTRFVIDRSGKVVEAEATEVTLPDAEVARCVVDGFRTLSFPSPENGIVTVVYPIMLSPG